MDLPVVLNLTWWLSVVYAGHSHRVNVRSQRSPSVQKVAETVPGGMARPAEGKVTAACEIQRLLKLSTELHRAALVFFMDTNLS